LEEQRTGMAHFDSLCSVQDGAIALATAFCCHAAGVEAKPICCSEGESSTLSKSSFLACECRVGEWRSRGIPKEEAVERSSAPSSGTPTCKLQQTTALSDIPLGYMYSGLRG